MAPDPLSGEDPRTIAELTELAGGLAHELRNPLSTLMINLKLLAEDLQDPAAAPQDVRRRALLRVGVLTQEAQRLQTLFDEFLQVSTPCQPQRQEVDVRAVLRRLALFVEPLARRDGIELRLDDDATPVRCLADENLLSRTLLNIALNGLQAMPEGGTLHLRARAEGDDVTIEFADTGVGILPEHRDRIFRPFFSTKPGGTGLGLSICNRIVRAHGGTLTFASTPGEGTTFTITLPS
ncbi:MAG TPA: ATP-binding protein [Phycisphaerae bacterium]|nr:ATP-binding protein [Phycisphaerae bacterium]HNU43947.1 ATP-binding protein [Phycisphaerae bacterium]